MNNLSETVLIIIAVMLFVLAVPVVIALIRNRGEIKIKDVSLSIGHRSLTDPNIKRISEYMTDKLEQIRQRFFAGYLRLQKEQGCPEEILNENADSEFVRQMLGNIIWSGNGISSIKSIIEKSLLDKSFLEMEYAQLVQFLMESIEQQAKNYINRNYRTRILYPTGGSRERIVSNTEWIDSLPNCMTEVRLIVENILTFARGLYKGAK